MVSYAHKSTIIMFRCAIDKFSSNAFITNSQKDYIVEETEVKYLCTKDESRAPLIIIRTFILEASPDFIQADQEQLLEGKDYKKKIPQTPASKIKLPRKHQRGDCEDFLIKPS
ncbi:unnamed protein product [Cuscuta europaea]|uniref:Uncharacterized protein n=1 Tax=Cuscuta europaea TaxID=41803 RepID=A0A9P0VVY2_CUSEU|nr:unnamed protein product [Cuscuta europaea]